VPAGKPLRIFSNFRLLDELLKGDSRYQHTYIGDDRPLPETIGMLLKARRGADFLLLNIDPKRLLLACAMFLVLSPRAARRCKIVSVDLLLRPPRGLRDRLLNFVKSVLYGQVDLFALYFRDLDGYVKHFRIPRERVAYVPFKVNSWEKVRARRDSLGEGNYALLSGATFRDHATFVAAVRKAGVPAVLLVPGDAREKIERKAWFRVGLPPNLRLDYHTDGKEETFLKYFEEARIACFPRFKWDIASSGISGYLCAMGLGRYVAISRGPGADDVLAGPGAADFFDPGDSDALAALIRGAWENPEHCRKVAANGARYAESLAGEERLLHDLLALLEKASGRTS
jgi:glycosyltransferase involved in cell wall biosynthesis